MVGVSSPAQQSIGELSLSDRLIIAVRLVPIRFWRMVHGWVVNTLEPAAGGE